MSDIAIRVENLSKMYRIGETIRQDTLRDAMVHRLCACGLSGDQIVFLAKPATICAAALTGIDSIQHQGVRA